MKNSYILQSSVLFFFVVIFSLPSNAAVSSMTSEIDVRANGLKIGKKVVVNCRNGRGKYEIFKKGTERQWCDLNFGDVCSSLKISAAQRVCSRGYRDRVALTDGADSTSSERGSVVNKNNIVDKEVLRAELIEIEQKRLNIAKKVQELKKRELELQNVN